jgi:hypothetical protein
MPERSAGLVLLRRIIGELEVLLVHPGGPWTKKDEGAWSIPEELVELSPYPPFPAPEGDQVGRSLRPFLSTLQRFEGSDAGRRGLLEHAE